MRLNRRIEIWEKSQEVDANGAPVANAFKRWKPARAQVEDKGGSEGLRSEAGERIGSVVTEFTIRDTCCGGCGGPRAKQITPDMRIRFNGENYNIIATRKYNKNPRFIVIIAERSGFYEGANE